MSENGDLKAKSIGKYARRAAPVPVGCTYDVQSDILNCIAKSEHIETMRVAENVDIFIGAESGEIIGLRIFEVKALIHQLFGHLESALPNVASELQSVRDLILAMLSNPTALQPQSNSAGAVKIKDLLHSKVAEEKLPPNFAVAA